MSDCMAITFSIHEIEKIVKSDTPHHLLSLNNVFVCSVCILLVYSGAVTSTVQILSEHVMSTHALQPIGPVRELLARIV